MVINIYGVLVHRIFYQGYIEWYNKIAYDVKKYIIVISFFYNTEIRFI